jgi:hypothetical protein
MLVANRKQLSPAVRVLREFLMGRCRTLLGVGGRT